MKKYSLLFFLFINLSVFSQQNTAVLNATIIGSGSPKYNPERSGPSVLINYKNTYILVDMGNGTQANLDKNEIKIKQLDGLLFTHHHLDHNEEFVPIFIKSLLGGNTFTVAGPTATAEYVSNNLALYNDDINYRMRKSGRTVSEVKANFSIKEFTGGETFAIDAIKITTAKVNHTISAIAYRFDAGGTSIVISGDLTYSQSLSKLALHADYLIIDSGGTIAKGAKPRNNKSGNARNNSKKIRAHVNLDESSSMAKEAKVKNLVMTHFSVTDIDEDATTREINKNYTGTVIFAEDLMTLPQTGITKTTVTKKQSAESTNTNKTANRRPNFDNLLKRMDSNKNGTTEESEAKGKLKDNFKKRDKNNDGAITEQEFGTR